MFGQWTDGNWYPGKIGTINADGTYGVNYDDGDVSPSLPANKVRRPLSISVPRVAPMIADTPAGRTLRAWLDAFNSGDEARMRAFAERHKTPGPELELSKQTGGFHLLGIRKSDRLAITFLVKEKASPTIAVGWLNVKDADPAPIESLMVLAIPPGLTPEDMEKRMVVDAATRTRVLDAIVAKLTDLYVFPDVARKMEQALREHAKKGEYEGLGESRAFAALLTEQLQAVSHDRHLHVSFVPIVLPERDPEPTAADKERMREELDVAGPELAAAVAPLIDEYRLYFRPYVLGGGKPYFAGARPPLRLVATDRIGEDAVRLTYVPA